MKNRKTMDKKREIKTRLRRRDYTDQLDWFNHGWNQTSYFLIQLARHVESRDLVHPSTKFSANSITQMVFIDLRDTGVSLACIMQNVDIPLSIG